MYSYRGCVSYEGVAIIIKLPLPFSTLAIVSLGRSRSKSIEVGTEKSLDDCFI